MKKSNPYLSKVLITDLQLTFDLINEKTARRWSLNPSEIMYTSHKTWLKIKLKKKRFYFWKLIKNSKCYGLVRIELIKKKYELSYLISKKYRGKGLGAKMIIKAIDKFNKDKIKNILYAKSFIKNYASNNTLLNSGFKLLNKKKNINIYVYKKYKN